MLAALIEQLTSRARRFVRGGGLAAGSLDLHALSGPVEVRLDDAEVPYIYATSVEDALVAQGYVHAAHRLFQMEFMRRFAQGRVSELLGDKPLAWQDTSLHFDGSSTVDLDALLRAFELREAAELSLAQAAPSYVRLVEHYVAGVNEYIARHRPRRELELLLLGADVQPWTTLDPFLLYKGFSYHLCFIWTAKLTLHALLGRFPERADAMRELVHGAARVPDAAFRAAPVLEDLAALGRAAVGFSGYSAGAYGSNCWAVSGERASKGQPLLACDPHLPLMAPSLAYLSHLEAPGLKVAGMGGPGIPGVTIGHNEHYAWGLTHAWLDDCDVFTESADATFERREIEVPVRGESSARRVSLRVGPRGPLVSDLVASGANSGNSRNGNGRTSGTQPLSLPAFSLRWSGRDGGRDLEAYWAIDRGASWGEFREACALFATPAWNMVYADRRGHIGYQLAGWVPRRPWGGSLDVVDTASVKRHNGGWRGYLAPSELLHSFDPPEGIIASANDRIADDSYPHYLSDLFEPNFRARRVREQLAASEDHDVGSMRALQNDDFSAWADGINRDVLQPLRGELANPVAERALALLGGWDGRFTVDAAGAALFSAFIVRYARRVLERTLGRELAAYVLELYTMPALTVQKMLQNNTPAWFAGSRPPSSGNGAGNGAGNGSDSANAAYEAEADEQRRRFVEDCQSTLVEAYRELEGTLGAEPTQWRWGALHQRAQRHLLHAVPVLRRLFSVGFVASPGDSTTVNSGILRFNDPYRQFGGADARLIVDLADLDASRWVLATGQSGHPLSSHYRDQFSLLSEGRDRAWPFSRDAVKRAAPDVLSLRPGGEKSRDR